LSKSSKLKGEFGGFFPKNSFWAFASPFSCEVVESTPTSQKIPIIVME
jgi:hypothetical protein